MTILIAFELFEPSAVFFAWLVTLAGYAVYAWKRPVGGLDCFLAFASPVASAWVIYLVSGLPHRAVAALMLALGLLALMVLDREDRDALQGAA